MWSQKLLRDELKFLTEFSALCEVLQQTAVAQLRRADEQLARRPSLAEVLRRECLPLLPAAAQEELLVRGGGAGRLVIVVTSDEGLVGPLYASVIRHALEHDDPTAQWIAIGHRGLRFLDVPASRLRVMSMPVEEDAQRQMQRLARVVLTQFTRERLRDAWLVAPHYVSATRQTVVAHQVLPLPVGAPSLSLPPNDIVIEPSVSRVVEALAALWVEWVCVESLWSARRAECAARALHMESARQELAKHRQQLRYESFKQLHGHVDAMVRETYVVQRLSGARQTAQAGG